MKNNKKAIVLALLVSSVINPIASTSYAADTTTQTESSDPSTDQGQQDTTNYANDEKSIKDYSKKERYRSTQMEQGAGTTATSSDPSMESKDGFSYKTLEPGAGSPDKKQWGIEIEFDKEKGQRTYTDFGFSNSGNLNDVLDIGSVSANEVGDKLSDKGDFQDPNYKSESEIEITASGRALKNLNLYASEEDIKHINNINNKNTVMAWEGKYKKDNPYGPYATQGGSATFTFTVNPWPNENDKLSLIKLNGSHDKKEFVQGQTINTGVKVENLDANARERLVGQVYHPITGKVVEGAKAYIDENDRVVVEMPKGAVDENGNINEDSIFYNDVDYKGLQNLEVKFFARPRTAAEFRAIIENDEDNYGTYTSTGAGEATINHKGTDVVIDKQGIDRYDHYNLIGGFKLNLDDTRYYDQGFIDGNQDDTSKHISSAVKPGEEFNVDLYVPEDKKDKDLFPNQKTPKEMQDAKDAKQATASVDRSFLKKANEGKKPEDQWQLEFDESNPTSLKIIPPKSAKAGEFVAVPLTYTYTNGSTDVHWFHFVVQESTYIKPEYETQVNFPINEQTSPAIVTQDDKRISPKSYSLPGTLETDESGNKLATDDKGNKWTVKIDEKTGMVSAKPVNSQKFDGGEKLTVPVIAHYVDKQKPGEDITEEANAYFVIEEKANMTPRYNAKAGKTGDELSSNVILNEEDRYNRRPGKYTLDLPTYTDDKGNTWNVSIDEETGVVKATVPNAEEGKSIDGALLNVPVTAHYYEEDDKGNKVEAGTKTTEVQFVASGTDGEYKTTQEIPFETKVEKDPKLKKGEIKVITEGKLGSKEVTYVIKDSQIDESKTTEKILEEPQERLIHVGEGTEDGEHKIEEKVEVPYEVEIQFDDNLAPGEQEVEQEGVPGEKTRTTKLTIVNGEVTETKPGEFTETKAPKKKIIKIGRNTEGEVKHVEEIPFNYKVNEVDTLKKGEYEIVKSGKVGTKTTTWTIENSKVVGKPKVETTDPVNAVINVGKGTNDGTHEITETEVVPFETILEFDDSLAPGEQKVTQEGVNGEKQRTTKLTIQDGKVTNTETGEYTETTAPTNKIIKVGRNTDGTVSHEEEIPFNYDIQYDPELESGEYVVDTEGQAGTKTTTWNIENSKVVGEPTIETTDPVNAKIRVGSKDFTGTFETKKTNPVEFETEYVVDNSLEPGTTVVEQEGSLGEEETTVTHKIENGKVVESTEDDTTQTKAPTKRIVKVGPAKTDGTHTYTSKKPFDVEVRVNPDLAKGEYNVIQEGVEGEEEYTITIENSKVTETSEPKETKAPVNEIIEIGSEDYTGTLETKKTSPVPFETEYIEDETLEPGKTVVDQEGEIGEETVTITHTIVNGEVTESKEGEPTRTKEPVKRIVRVGKKPAAPTNGETTKKVEREIPYETKVIYDDTLDAGSQVVDQEGKPGKEEVTITQKVEDSNPVGDPKETTKTITEKEDRVVRVGTKPVKTVEDIPFNTIYKYDENKPAGQQEVTQEGKNGTLTLTTTFDKESKKLVVNDDVVDPTPKIITIGTAPVTNSNEIDFATEYIYDPNLEPGQEVVEQEGSKGKVTYTTSFNKETQQFETSQDIVPPVKRVVRVGTATDGTHIYEEDIQYDVQVISDPNLPAGEHKVVQQGALGKQTTTITIDNSEVVEKNTVENYPATDMIVHVGTGFTEDEDLREYGVVIVNYVDQDGLPIAKSVVSSVDRFGNGYDTTKDKLATIEFNGKTYELVAVVEGSETGTIDGALTQVTYAYKEVKDSETETPVEPGEETPAPTPEPEVPSEEETPRPEVPGDDNTVTPRPDLPEYPDKTPDTPQKPSEDIEDPIEKPELPDDREDSESETDIPSYDQEEIPRTDAESETKHEPETPEKSETSDETENIDDSDASDKTDNEDKEESADKEDTSKKPGLTDKKDTEDKTEIENEDSNISSDKVRVPRPSTTISSKSQVSSPARSSVVTRSSNKGASNNVQTGVSGTISVASILAAASAGLYATRKKEDEEE